MPVAHLPGDFAMYRWHPSSWLKWAPVMAGLPFLAAAALTSPGLHKQVAETAANTLKTNHSWASIEFDGRDATLRGDAPSQEAIDAAVKSVALAYGVRRIEAVTRIVKPVNLAAPAAESVTSPTGQPELKGTWPEGDAKTLSVAVGGKTYVLGKDPELISTAGTWTLTPSAPLPPGTYDIVTEISDGASNIVKSATPAKLVIAQPEPTPVVEPEKMAETAKPAPIIVPPTVATIQNDPLNPVITGTWPVNTGSTLAVVVDNQRFVLGKNSQLTSNDKGEWRLLLGKTFDDGLHTVTAEITTPDGKTLAAQSPAKIAIDTVPPTRPELEVPDTSKPWPYKISGTWPVGDAKTFAISLNGKTYILGRDIELLSDTKGRFEFSPQTQLQPGTYDLAFKLTDAAGNATNFTSKAAIFIPPPVQAAEVAPPAKPMAKLPAPTVTVGVDLVGATVVRGTWPTDQATALSVTINNKTYKLGADANLRTDEQGNWSLVVEKSLRDGVYDVVVDVTDDQGQTTRDTTVGELEVASTVPAMPTVTSISLDKLPAKLGGTWGNAKGESLSVTIPDLRLGGPAGTPGLIFDGTNWTLAVPENIAPGTYDVVVQSTDRFGRKQTDATTGELQVKAPPALEPVAKAPDVAVAEPAPEPTPAPVPAPAPAPAQTRPYDCADVIARISAVFPIRFEYNRTRLVAPNDVAVSQYAALLKDTRCMALQVQVRGHADDRGPVEYNQFLSELRADKVKRDLVAAGVAPSRITTVGFNESQPMIQDVSEDARAKNRRVEMTLSQ